MESFNPIHRLPAEVSAQAGYKASMMLGIIYFLCLALN